MPVLSTTEAIERLSHAVERMDGDDLCAVLNELFPEEEMPDVSRGVSIPTLKKRIFDHIRRGLEIEEVLDLWNVVFPDDHDVSYDAEEDEIHFHVESQSIGRIE